MRKLYYHPLHAGSRIGMFALSEKKLDFSIELTRFWDVRTIPEELNSFRRIPILIEINGTVISGTYVLVEYLEETYHEFPILGAERGERAEARRIFQWVQEDFSSEITNTLSFEKGIKRYFVQDHSQSTPSSSVLKQIKVRSEDYLKQIESFSEQRNWLAGNAFSIADIAVAANMSILDYMGFITWDHYPFMKEWYVRIKSRPSFQRLLRDRIPGIPPVSYYANPDF